jgi:hypothetical protein
MPNDNSSDEIDEGSVQELIRKNIDVLNELYDLGEGAFNYSIYFNNIAGRLVNGLQIPYVSHLLRSVLPHSMSHGRRDARIDSHKDLKYHGQACVGLCKYILATKRTNSRLSNMVHSSVDYLIRHQTTTGAMACRYVRGNKIKYGTDRHSIAESSEALLWCLATSLGLYIDDENYRMTLTRKAKSAARWLMKNTEYLSAQEIGRVIYGLSELHIATREENLVSLIRHLGEKLVSRVNGLKSFGLFPQDIDTIGGLSVASNITGQKVFVDVATRLLSNQLLNQGPNGQWRWAFDKLTGHNKWLNDITYSVHQLGMAPWALSQYILASKHVHGIVERMTKGISWIIAKKAHVGRFVIRSFSGLTGNIYELEQRSYEPGLNALGLLSYSSIRGFQTRCALLGQV